ncbi:hypothetical protein BDV10DRAFT_191108 [Aspergillus recurvatus]
MKSSPSPRTSTNNLTLHSIHIPGIPKDPVLRRAHVSRLVDSLSTPGNSPHVQQAMKEQAFLTLEVLSKSDPAAHGQWPPIAICRRQRQFENILAERQERSVQEARARETGHQPPRDRPQMALMNQDFHYEDIPFLGPPPAYYNTFEFACRKGPVATVESILSSEACTPTPAFLHHGLCLALKAGNLDVARYLLTSGAPISRRTPEHILSSPINAQIPLFELFTKHGWTPNTPGMYGAVLLPSIMTNHILLEWFLAHGANPNLRQQKEHRFGGSIANSCTALEKAAYRGDVEAVPGACPLDWNPHIGRATPGKGFDRSMIPVMALLVERGAEVNQYQGPQRGNQVPNYAIVEAVKAGAVARVRWLLENGADPTKRGSWGNAAEYAAKMENKRLLSHIMEKQAGDLPVHCKDQSALSTAPRAPQCRRISHRLVGFLGVISCLWLTLHWLPITYPTFKISSCHHHARPASDGLSFDGEEVPTNPTPADSKRVPFEAHIMSKCPDARDCIRELVVPTMEKISDKVDFELSFIATVSNKSSDVECMHGPGECIGDMLMLCAANLPFKPEDGPAQGRTPTVRYLGFATCLISSYQEIPDRMLVEQCALEHGIDFDALNDCVSQQDDDPNKSTQDGPLSGVRLLRESARHSAELGVKTSCTVRLDDVVWCVRDGGVWKDCAKEGEGSKVPVLVDEIEKLWGQRN